AAAHARHRVVGDILLIDATRHRRHEVRSLVRAKVLCQRVSKKYMCAPGHLFVAALASLLDCCLSKPNRLTDLATLQRYERARVGRPALGSDRSVRALRVLARTARGQGRSASAPTATARV